MNWTWFGLPRLVAVALAIVAALDPSHSLVPQARLRGELIGDDGPCADLLLRVEVEPSGAWVVRTDDEGRFEVAVDGFRAKTLIVAIEGRGLGPSEVIWNDPKPGELVELGRLGPPASCVGRVVDAFGDALGGEWMVLPSPRSIRPGHAAVVDRSMGLQSAEAGEFELSGLLAAQAYLAVVRMGGGGPRASAAADLEPGIETFVEVRCLDTKLNPVTVRFDHPWGEIGLGSLGLRLFDALGREHTRYMRGLDALHFGGLRAGTYDVQLDDPRFERRRATARTEDEVVFDLVSTTTLQLEVEGGIGGPVDGWTARAYLSNGTSLAVEPAGLGLPPAPVEVVVEAPGRVPRSIELPRLAPGERRQVSVRLDEGRPIDVIVRWADGNPLPAARVTAVTGQGRARHVVRARTGAAGRARLENVGRESGDLIVDLGGGHSIQQELAASVVDPILVVPGGGWIDLELTLPAGLPADSELFIEFDPPAHGRIPGAVLPLGGKERLRLGPLVPGDWTLYLALLHEQAELLIEVQATVVDGRAVVREAAFDDGR